MRAKSLNEHKQTHTKKKDTSKDECFGPTCRPEIGERPKAKGKEERRKQSEGVVGSGKSLNTF
jgi:hypothetical protein